MEQMDRCLQQRTDVLPTRRNSKMTAPWIGRVLMFASIIAYVTALRCRLCDRARNREQCQGYAECAYDQECFLDEIITDLLETVYVGGCRAKNVCGSTSVVGKRSLIARAQGDAVACSRCCTGEYCNEKLCGLPRDTTLLHCNACGDFNGDHISPPVRYPEDCTYSKACQHDEMCFASTEMFNGVKLQHTTKCMQKSVKRCLHSIVMLQEQHNRMEKTCHRIMNATFEIADTVGTRFGRYLKPICAVCCGDDYCNTYACETVKRHLLSLRADGFLDYENLKEDIWGK